MKYQTAPDPALPKKIWEEHLSDMFQTLGICSGIMADNISASVADYCHSFHPQGLQTSDLNLLIARAFCAVGDPGAAEKVLKTMETHRPHISRWLEILTELHHFPELLPYFSSGVIRPADWAGAQLDRMWVLDFGRLMLNAGDKHEMMLYRSIRLIIEKVSVFWNATEGEGILGLKSLSALNLDTPNAAKPGLTATEHLMDYIGDLLFQQKTLRGWGTAPALLNLDL